MFANLGDSVSSLIPTAKSRVVLAAPFIKEAAIRRLLDGLGDQVRLTVVTRWIPEEISAGVSDIGVWDCVREIHDADLRLLPNLHAKYFRIDEDAYVGSANITARALGWSARPNLEILISVPAKSLGEFEDVLLSNSFEVDEETAVAMRAASMAVPPPRGTLYEVGDSDDLEEWFPLSDQVQHLYECYQGNEENIISTVYQAGISDLDSLSIPAGLNRNEFRHFISARLQELSYVAAVDAAATSAIDRPQGQALLAELGVAENSPSCDEWDRLVRWLVYFLENRFRSKNTWSGPALERSQVLR